MKAIKNILIYGAGAMGRTIAVVFAAKKEHQVTFYVRTPRDVHGSIRETCKPVVEKGIITATDLEERLARISVTLELDSDAVKNADLVMESISEDMALKQEAFAKLEEHCRPDAIFCTNSSVMSPSEISSKLKHRERFVGMHFWNPAHLVPLVEVIKSDATSDEVAQLSMDFLAAAGKRPVLCKKDVPGFIANRLQQALKREAHYIVEQGIADAKTVDDAIRYSFGLRLPQMGVCEQADMNGLDMTLNIQNYINKYLCNDTEASPLIKQLVAEGKTGFKKGEGFMKWTPEEAAKSRANLNEYLVNILASGFIK